jgi:hypothetical protein
MSYAQISVGSGIYFAKEFSKKKSLYKAKEFVMSEVIGVEKTLTKFDIDPLAAASSGELTSLVYSCKSKNISGLVLGFYGNRWNEAGVRFQLYAFKNLVEEEALVILSKIKKYIHDESKYLSSDFDNNNIYFKHDDMTFLIYKDGNIKIRVFWNGFDSEWGITAFGRTQRRFERKIKSEMSSKN